MQAKTWELKKAREALEELPVEILVDMWFDSNTPALVRDELISRCGGRSKSLTEYLKRRWGIDSETTADSVTLSRFKKRDQQLEAWEFAQVILDSLWLEEGAGGITTFNPVTFPVWLKKIIDEQQTASELGVKEIKLLAACVHHGKFRVMVKGVTK